MVFIYSFLLFVWCQWLGGGGDLGGSFSGVDSYTGEGRHQDLRQQLPSQQPQAHQMVSVVMHLPQKRSHSYCFPWYLCCCVIHWVILFIYLKGSAQSAVCASVILIDTNLFFLKSRKKIKKNFYFILFYFYFIFFLLLCLFIYLKASAESAMFRNVLLIGRNIFFPEVLSNHLVFLF